MPPPGLSLAIEVDVEATNIAEVVPGLFVGGREAAQHPPDSVRRIVNATQWEPNHHAERGVAYLQVDVEDTESAKIAKYFDESNAFIAAGLEAGVGVLIHCKEGISRSSTLAVAYCMAKRGQSLAEALEQMRAARPIAKPNKGFLEQLAQYEASLRAAGKR